MKPLKKIVAFGNPLLDTTILISDTYLLKKYNLKENDQKEIPKTELDNLFRDVSGYEQHINAGGCAQNCLRVLQWLLKKQCDATIFGSVGDDEEAQVLRKLLTKDGVKTKYFVQNDLPTGKTIGLVKGENRSLVAYIGAAEKLPLADLLADENYEELVGDSDFIYVEGFFLTNRIGTAEYVLTCNQNTNEKIIIFNISGEYICDILPQTVKYFVEHSDVVFGNRKELEAVRKIMKLSTITDLANFFVKNGRNKMKKYGNMIVITDGPKAVTCFYHRGKIKNFEVPQMNKNDIKDTTGAGDAFAGGFIAGLCRNASVEDCARIGCYAANQIIRQIGCSLPKIVPDILNY